MILETRPTQLPESVPLFGSKGKNNKCKLDFLGPMIGPGDWTGAWTGDWTGDGSGDWTGEWTGDCKAIRRL